jgi:hypothetical protein
MELPFHGHRENYPSKILMTVVLTLITTPMEAPGITLIVQLRKPIRKEITKFSKSTAKQCWILD